jgi:hypothetical protein
LINEMLEKEYEERGSDLSSDADSSDEDEAKLDC